MLIDGAEFEDFFETEAGPVRVQSKVLVRGTTIVFEGLTLYPLTGSFLPIGAGVVFRIFRSLMDEAREQGFARCSVVAFRTGGARPGRMITVTRRLV